MISLLTINNKKYAADLSDPLDISLAIQQGSNNPNCYWADPVTFETISSGSFIGSVKAGGSVNYQKLTLTPHGNGTHTECYGHISDDEQATINQCLTQFHFSAEVISVTPEKEGDWDSLVTLNQIKEKVNHPGCKALVIRTLPNDHSKKNRQYSGTNPPYLEAAAAAYLAEAHIDHLLIDVPSVDREADGGKLSAHKAFWKFPENIRRSCTITELIYVDKKIPDGLYLLNLQIISLVMDASPSKPVLYKLTEVL